MHRRRGQAPAGRDQAERSLSTGTAGLLVVTGLQEQTLQLLHVNPQRKVLRPQGRDRPPEGGCIDKRLGTAWLTAAADRLKPRLRCEMLLTLCGSS